MELNESEQYALYIAARLHDIGKALIFTDLLDKARPLTPGEWALMKQHPQHGAEIAAFAALDSDVWLVIRHHHERWDGLGYPDGLSGHRIPRLARILAVADAYDAMTHDRPYRAAVSPEGAFQELRAASGTQFDPDIVAAFEALSVPLMRDLVGTETARG